MSLSNMSVLLGAATCVASGGTAATFTPNGKKISGNGIMIANASEINPKERETITAYANTPSYNNTTGVWSDESREVTFARPVEQPDGTFKFRTIRVKTNFEAGISAADLEELRVIAAQLAIDPDTDSFYISGDLS